MTNNIAENLNNPQDNNGHLKSIRFGTHGDRRYKKEDILKILKTK